MKKGILIRPTLFITLLISGRQPIFPQSPDTLYFNAGWQICEKPLAQYYRFGRIVIGDSWYYTGKVRDFYLSDVMQMDGNYSSSGNKEGKFYFFYKDGTLASCGSYSNNFRVGTWEYYYAKGPLMSRVRFCDDGKNFVLLDYFNPQGEATTKDSTGTFSLYLSPGESYANYRVTGEFKKGKKTGTWEYFIENSNDATETIAFRELFKDDRFQKGFAFNNRGGIYAIYKQQKFTSMIPEYNKFSVTETFKKDRTSFRHVTDDIDLKDYLISRREPEFTLDTSSYFSSQFGVLNTLNTFSILKHFNDPEKIYKGEAIFILTDSGSVKEIEITGNLSEKERSMMLFFLKKFRTFNEIVSGEENLTGEHKIYFFTAYAKDILPVSMRVGVNKRQFFFSPWPYKAFAERIKSVLKKSLKNDQ